MRVKFRTDTSYVTYDTKNIFVVIVFNELSRVEVMHLGAKHRAMSTLNETETLHTLECRCVT